MASGPDEIMTIDELAVYLKISKSTLYKLAQEYLGELEEDKIIKTRTGIKDTLVPLREHRRLLAKAVAAITGKAEEIGEVNDDEYKRLQIRKTIEEHLDKEMQLRPQGLKVLSLFFVDRVANYRVVRRRRQFATGQVCRDV